MASVAFPSVMSTYRKAERGLGWAIRSIRREQKRTLENVALEVGSDPGNLSRIERGAQDAPEGLLRAIAGTLGLSMAELWQVAELGRMDGVGIAAKAAQMTAKQREDLERYADFLLSQTPQD